MPTFKSAEQWEERKGCLIPPLREACLSMMGSLEEAITRHHLTLKSPGTEDRGICLLAEQAIKQGFKEPEDFKKTLSLMEASWLYGERIASEYYTYENGWITLRDVALRDFKKRRPWRFTGDEHRRDGLEISPWQDGKAGALFERVFRRQGKEIATLTRLFPTDYQDYKYEAVIYWYRDGLGQTCSTDLFGVSLGDLQAEVDQWLVERGFLPTQETTLVWDSDLPLSHATTPAREDGFQFIVRGGCNDNLIRDLDLNRTGLVYADVFENIPTKVESEPDETTDDWSI